MGDYGGRGEKPAICHSNSSIDPQGHHANLKHKLSLTR